ncbi:MAG: hypothetical protein RLZZ15_3900 [Verrucomicrobiota bacterium]|jgi:hypothetical protein
MKFAAWFCLLVTVASAAAPAPREEIVEIFGRRKFVVPVPAGCTLVRGLDRGGGVGLRLANADGTLDVHISFAADPTGEIAGSARVRKEIMVDAFSEFVADSKEKAMQFEEIEVRGGAGTYCVFTDEKLAGKTPPPGEFVYVTAGVRVSRGVAVLFKIFNNDLRAEDYREAMALVRETLRERPATPLL